ncbi:MAG: hypothetical protein EA357_07060 [Micavibrio sp.]|nr:MAG: hypothetical protein EA357_07060 [Micavibrio sp.]
MSEAIKLIDVIERKFEKTVGDEKFDSLGDWLYAAGKASEALLYSTLFMPELVEVDGSVLLAWSILDKSSKKRFLDNLDAGIESREVLEASFNFIEVGYLFNPQGRDTSDAEDELLAELLGNAWAGWLKLSYPERSFKVEVLSADITGSTVGVHFFEQR